MDKAEFVFAAIIAVMTISIAMLVGGIIGHYWGHKDGYLEACKNITEGKELKYELKEFPGGERKWIKRGETK